MVLSSKSALGTIGKTESNYAELWVVLTGLKLAIQLGLLNLSIRTDSRYVFNFLYRTQQPAWKHQRIIKEIRQLRQHFQQLELCFVFRESNGVADVLAKYGSRVLARDENLLSYPQVANPILRSIVVSDSCPAWLNHLVCKDLSVATSRLVSVNTSSALCNIHL